MDGISYGDIPESDHTGHEPETEHRTEEKPAAALHAALEKIMKGIRRRIMHKGKSADNAESDYDGCGSTVTEESSEIMEEEEGYVKAEHYMLTREERCHLKAQREMERLSRKSPVFMQCLASCVQTPIREGIAIGCPNVPVYRLVQTYTEDAQYLFPVYEP